MTHFCDAFLWRIHCDAFIVTHLLWRIYYWIIAYPTKVEEYLTYCNKAIQTNWRNVMWRIFETHFCAAFIVTQFCDAFLLNNNDTFKSWGAFDRLELGNAKLILTHFVVMHFKTSWVIKLPKSRVDEHWADLVIRHPMKCVTNICLFCDAFLTDLTTKLAFISRI